MEEGNQEKKTENQVAWSMDQARLQHINSMLVAVAQHSEVGHLDRVAQKLKDVKLNIIHSLDLEERNELKQLEKEMELCIFAQQLDRSRSSWENTVTYNEEQRDFFKRVVLSFLNKLKPKVEHYQERIMDLLDKYGYLSKKKKDKTNMGV